MNNFAMNLTAAAVLLASLGGAIYQNLNIGSATQSGSQSPQLRTLNVTPPDLLATPEMVEIYNAAASGNASQALLSNLMQKRDSLIPEDIGIILPELAVKIIDSKKIQYTTDPTYYETSPECYGDLDGYKIGVAAAFGLRGYILDDECIDFAVGSYDTSFYDVAYDQASGLIAFSIPGQGLIEVYSESTMDLVLSIGGYSATALAFDEAGDLFFGAHKAGGNWEEASIYKASMPSGQVVTSYMRGQLADPRGLNFSGSKVIVSDSANDRILVTNHKFQVEIEIDGLNYPNEADISSTGSLLVADEHNGRVLEVSLETGDVLWSSPPYQVFSPSSVVELTTGELAGNLLIGDADGNRVIIAEKEPWKVVFEASPIRAALGTVVIEAPEQSAAP